MLNLERNITHFANLPARSALEKNASEDHFSQWHVFRHEEDNVLTSALRRRERDIFIHGGIMSFIVNKDIANVIDHTFSTIIIILSKQGYQSVW